MKHFFILTFLSFTFSSFGQLDAGTIHYTGRVTHMYDAEGYQIEIPYEKQNSNEVFGEIYFDSLNLKIDFIATIVYMLNVTLQKEKQWVLYHKRFGSDKTAETVFYDDLLVYQFDSLSFHLDTVRTIAGYSCHMANYYLTGIPYEAWFSTDIHLGGNLLPIPDDIRGACLEFTLLTDIADVKYTAKTVDPTPPKASRFEMVLLFKDALKGTPLFPLVERIYDTPTTTSIPETPPPPPPMRVE